MYADEDVPAGWLTQFRRGVFSGSGLLLLAVAGCTIPAFLVWLVPGADTTPATSAVKAGGLLALAAAHGGIQLNGETVTLAPLLVTVLIGWLVAGQARRSDSWSAILGLSVGYGLSSGLLARWAQLGSTRAPSLPSLVAGFVFVLLVAGAARMFDQLWPRLSDRVRRVLRAALAMVSVYAGTGALLVAGSLSWHFGDATEIQRQVAPGIAGLPIALLGLAAIPNAVLAATGYLTGPGFQLGRHTSVSPLTVRHGGLPDFPLTAAVPMHATPAAGIVVLVLTAMLAGGLGLRLVADGRTLSRLIDALAAAVLAGGSLAAATALATGGIGSGALATVGSVWWAVGAAVIGLLGLSVAGWSGLARVRGAASEPVLELVPVPRLRSVPTEREDDEPGHADDVRTERPAVGDGPADVAKPSRHVS